jgi:DNA-binding transcriptional ArsR family regulator
VSPDAGQLIAAMNHPVRRRILWDLRHGRAVSATQLSKSLDEPLANVCYHVNILVDLEVLKLVGMRQVRGAKESFYRSSLDQQESWPREALEACQRRDEAGR